LRLYRYISGRGGFQPRLAVAPEAGPPVDLLDAWQELTGTSLGWDETGFLVSFMSLIEDGPALWREISEVCTAASTQDHLVIDQSGNNFRPLCPFDRLASLKDFLTFEDHVKLGAERRDSDVPSYWYEAPVYYKGNHRSLIGPEEVCRWPRYAARLDFELELGMVIGRRGRAIPSAAADDYIFGFTIFNDFSARDMQAKEMATWLGPARGKDFCNSFGPCIVTAEEVGPEPDLEMICRVNDEEWGRARSSQMHWSWADLIAHVSECEDVYPGDLFGSGTPGGCCGLDLGRELQPGDVVELEIEKIGVLRNYIGTP
jgi:2-keto-4-pentenoate hydratase/2-oxohepta-3-ene-1,7-dioic acid hydratase in catechol pathway